MVDEQLVRSAYQPLVDLRTGEVVGYEALARGPRGSDLENPASLFRAGRIAGLETELEWECQRAALAGVLETPLASDQALFMNVEPAVPISSRPQFLSSLNNEVCGRVPVFVELTERALTDNPAELLASVREIRALGARIALDDIGADPRSLALMPFLAPEVLKLDLRLVQENPSGQIAAIAHAVGAEAERTGACILAEGIETEEHRETALALGARYGQGWLYGRPGALPAASPPLAAGLGPNRQSAVGDCQSPFEAVARDRPARQGDKRLLLELSLQIEAEVRGLGAATVVLATFQDASHFTSATATRYADMAGESALVAALGIDMPPEPAAGVRGVALDCDDPLRGEWDVAVISPHFAMAFVARDMGDDGADLDRRFDFAVTYDRRLAVDAASVIMSRLHGA